MVTRKRTLISGLAPNLKAHFSGFLQESLELPNVLLEDAVLAPTSQKKLIEILIKLIETYDFGGFHEKMIRFLSLTTMSK